MKIIITKKRILKKVIFSNMKKLTNYNKDEIKIKEDDEKFLSYSKKFWKCMN